MCKTLLSLFISIFLLIPLAQGQSDCFDDQLLIKMQKGHDVQQWAGKYSILNLKVNRKLVAPVDLYIVAWDAEKMPLARFQAQLENDPVILAHQRNCLAQERNTNPNDPLFEDQWNMDLVGASRLWDITTGGQTIDGDPIVVAVLDSGTDVFHDDLLPNLWINEFEIDNDGIDNDNNGYVDDVYGWNMQTQTDDHVVNFHGTSVAGIIGAGGDNGIGVSGINWNIGIMNFSKVNSMPDATEALYYCFEQRKRYNESNGAQGSFVVAANYSKGFDELFCGEFPIWDEAFDSLGTVGILSVGATANRDYDVDIVGDIPSGCASDFLIAVTNIDETDQKVGNAAYGATSIDLAAPGNGVLTSFPLNEYMNFSGTSGAAPHVAGAIGLLYSIPCSGFIRSAKEDPMATALAVKSAILSGVDQRASLRDITVSGGRLNVWNSFLELDRQFGPKRGSFDLVNLHPNPASDWVKVTTMLPEPGDYKYRIVNSIGKQFHGGILSGFCLDAPQSVNLGSLKSGFYYFQLYNGDESATLPLVIQ